MQRKPLSVYVHIPFCVQKCLYCDFLSGKADAGTREAYVRAVLGQIDKEAGDGQFDDYEVQTVYFGGGTPSTLHSEQIERMLCKLKNIFCFTKSMPEISMEMNPGTVNAQQLQELYAAGINRISIGLQSLQDAELQKLGRIHHAEDFYRVWEEAAAAGFRNRNVDLMSGIPGQSVESLENTLRRLTVLSPEHISAYSLIVEEGTPFAKMYPYGAVDEETDRQMYELTGRILAQAGYERYEISNYSRAGMECRHNIAYWERQDYLGIGIGAASLIRNTRYKIHDNLLSYISGEYTHENTEHLTVQDRMSETMFLGLRMIRGVSKRAFEEQFHKTVSEVYGDVIEQHVKNGLLKENGDRIFLTKRGMDVSNYVMSDFV